jgi:hypothetical protein
MVRFGDSDAFIINDLDLKTKIIDYLFNISNLSKYRYNMLDNIQQLNFLKSNEHYVSPNFKGFNYFLLFYKFNNSPYCVAIDKKNLSYHRNTIDLKKVMIFRIKVMTSPSIFRGSLFDAKLIKNIMLIKDCYYLMGNDITNMDMIEKMIYLDSIVANQFQKDYSTNFKLKINKLYNYNMLNDIVNNIIPKCELEITGLIFYPKISGVSYIYNDKQPEKNKQTIISNGVSNEVSNTISNDSYNMIFQITDFLKSRSYSYETTGKKKVLTIEPTNISDVYNLYDNDDKLGIAHIPNYKISTYCRENIKEKTKCMCIFNKQFNKWIPLNIA